MDGSLRSHESVLPTLGRAGHFRLESGHHSRLWYDLDALFAEPRRIEPLVTRLSNAMRPHDVAVVCGPLLGGAFLAQLVSHALGVAFCFTERGTTVQGDSLYEARYRLPSALTNQVRAKRCAIVDDVMSAGSALRGTYLELQRHGAVVVVVGALWVLGDAGARFFAQAGVPLEAVAREEFQLWPPRECPLCAAGAPLEEP